LPSSADFYIPSLDPIDYFAANDFAESLILSIRHDPGARRLTFVVTYADIQALVSHTVGGRVEMPPRTYDRDFRELTFAGVEALRRDDTLWRHGFQGFDRHDLNYSSAGSAVVIDDISVQAAGDA
jgi:hypothetical protein